MLTPSKIREVAIQSLFKEIEALCDGAIIVDASARITWINENYAHKLGLADATEAVGQLVEDVLPNSKMREVALSGVPTVLDIMPFGDEHVVVMRLPLRDDKEDLIGAIGFVLYDRLSGLKPLVARFAQLESALAKAQQQLAEERRAKYTLATFLGLSAAAQEVKRQAKRAAQMDTTVLLTGATGTGKELIAHAIHNVSSRATKPFVSLNASAIPENLLEAELFGAAPGAYTGADRKGRTGKFQLADGGTLFLDEIGDMPLALQAKLLRVLQEQEIEPLGSNKLIRVNVRIITATSLDLNQRLADGLFRADLYYRLNVLEIHLPTLQERLDDLPLLTEHILDDMATRTGMPAPELAPNALAVLARYDWPGNVRQLRNILERAWLANEVSILTAEHVAKALGVSHVPAEVIDASMPKSNDYSLAHTVAKAERQAIVAALAQTADNKVKAAQLLGISRTALYQKLAMLGFH